MVLTLTQLLVRGVTMNSFHELAPRVPEAIFVLYQVLSLYHDFFFEISLLPFPFLFLTNSIHELALHVPVCIYGLFQLSFAIITPAVICGSFADRMRLGSLCVSLCVSLFSLCLLRRPHAPR